MCLLVTHQNLRRANDTIATKPTSGGQRNLFLTIDTLFMWKVLTHMCTPRAACGSLSGGLLHCLKAEKGLQAGLGQLPVALVKQGLQMGRRVQ